MKTRRWTLVALPLALIGGGVGLLLFFQSHQRLGQPGIRVVPEPIYDPDGKVVGTQSAYLPEKVLDYSSKPMPVTHLELDWLPADTTFGRRGYKASDGFETLASIVLMGTDRTSIHKPQYCLTGQGWRIDASEMTTISVKRPHPYELPVMKLSATTTKQTADGQNVMVRGIYVYWFVADHALTADHLQRMWWMASDLIRTGTLQRWAYVSCFSVCLPGQEDATFQRMKEFLVAAVPEFQVVTGALAGGEAAGQTAGR